MSLPEPWVDRIFTKLTLTYGQAFLRQYDGIPMPDVKSNWGHELAGFQQHPDAIRYGLSYLPTDRPPTVLQFRDICRRGIAQSPIPALPAPSEPASQEVIEKAVAAVKLLRDATPGRGWAHRLKEREEAGERLSVYQRHCWREALGVQQ